MSSWEQTAMQMLSGTPEPQAAEPPRSAPPPAASPPAPPSLSTPSSGAVIARAAQSVPAEPAAATFAQATPSATISRAAAGSGSGGGGGDDGYEQFLDRLRRDLLREREQIGDLLGETPW